MVDCARLYECFLRDTLRKVSEIEGASVVIAYSPADSLPYFNAIADGRFELVPQVGDDLGERISSCARRFCPTVIMGADAPTLPVGYIQLAISRLENGVDVVFGPASDGGYYLVGMSEPYLDLLREIPWSTSAVLSESLRRCRDLGLNYSMLPEWYDVDTPGDLAHLYRDLSSDRCRQDAPSTASILDELRVLV
jgi:rSAM/selenodomain-associated transferase 1